MLVLILLCGFGLGTTQADDGLMFLYATPALGGYDEDIGVFNLEQNTAKDLSLHPNEQRHRNLQMADRCAIY
jgi:hypothetical protein